MATGIFGYNGAGGTSSTNASYCRADIGSYAHTAASGETVTKLWVKASRASGTGTIHLGIYTVSSGVPSTRVSSASITIPAGTTTATWLSATVSIALTAGVQYCIAEDANGDTGNTLYRDYGSSNTIATYSGTALPATWSPVYSQEQYMVCMYAEYTRDPMTVYIKGDTGSNSNPGTIGSPFQTYVYAKTIANLPGDTIYFLETTSGNYTERLVVDVGGDTTGVITIAGYPGDDVVFDFTGYTLPAGSAGGIRVSVGYVTLQNITVSNLMTVSTNTYAQNYSGVWIFGTSCSHVTCSHLTVTGCYSSGIFVCPKWNPQDSGTGAYLPLDAFLTGIIVDHCNVSNCGEGTNPGSQQENISLSGCTNFEVKYCTVCHSDKEGIDIKNGCSNGKVHHCEVWDTINPLYCDAGLTNQDNIEWYCNYSHDAYGWAQDLNGGAGGYTNFDAAVLASEKTGNCTNIKWYNNLLTGSFTGFTVEYYNYTHTISYEFYNNTCYGNSFASFRVNEPDSKCTGIVANNALYITGSGANIYFQSDYTRTTIDKNCLWNPDNTNGSYNTVMHNGAGATHILQNPSFVDAANGNWHLSAGSPCIDAGSASYLPGFDYEDNTRVNEDIGAFRYLGNITVTPSTKTLTINRYAPTVTKGKTMIPGTAALVLNNQTIQTFESYTTGDDGVAMIYGDYQSAQTFTPAVSHSLNQVKLKMRCLGISTTTCNIVIKATDSNGHPTGPALGESTVTVHDIVTWITTTFSPKISLTAGVKYSIVVAYPDGDNFLALIWSTDLSSGAYPGGNEENSSDGGLTWTARTYDFMFEENGTQLLAPDLRFSINLPAPTALTITRYAPTV